MIIHDFLGQVAEDSLGADWHPKAASKILRPTMDAIYYIQEGI